MKEKKKGPKSKSTRTEKLEKRVLAIRFKSPEKDMYGIIHVTYYRYPPELVPLFHGLNEKHKSKGINPKIPWLNNKIL